MKEKTKKRLSRLAKTTVGTVTFLGTIVGGYLLTPNRTKFLSIEVQQAQVSGFEKFLEKLQEDVGLNENEEEQDVEKFMKAHLNNINFAYKLSDSTVYNTLNVNGELDLRVRSLSDINFNLEADIDYNGKNLPLEVGFFNRVAYFGLKDLRLKMSDMSAYNLWDVLDDLMETQGFDYETLYDDLNELIKDKINTNFDISELVSKLTEVDPDSTSAMGFSIGEEEIRNDERVFPINVTFDEKDPETKEVIKSETLHIEIISTADYTLKSVDLGSNQTFKDFKLGGSIDFEYLAIEDFVTPDTRHPNYTYYEMFNYSGWLNKLVKFFKEDEQKIGINFAADLDYKGTKKVSGVDVPDEGDIARVEGSVNADFTKILDFSKYFGQESTDPKIDNDERTILEKLKDDVSFNLQLDLYGQNDVKYANLIFAYQEESGFIVVNEKDDGLGGYKSVMKAVIDTETANAIMEKVPNLLAAISGNEDNASLSTLFSSLLDDDGIGENIKKGDFSFVLDMLETLENDDKTITVGLDLSSLNIGENARVDIVLDSSKEETHDVLDVDATGIQFGSYALDLDVNSGNFNAYREISDEEAATFDTLSFVPSVLDQAADLVRTPKAGFTISGSVLDEEGLGLGIRGNAKFDNTEDVKAGFGVLYLDQYKYHAGSLWTTHKIALDVDNHLEHEVDEPNENLIKFAYNNDNHAEKVEGQVKIQTLSDIMDIVMTFVDDAKDDMKFKKFVAPITELLGVNELVNIIDQRDYVRLAGDEVVQSIAQFDEGGQKGLRIVVGASLFGINASSPIRIDILFDADSKISGIKLVDFKLGGDNVKTINLNINLVDYNSSSVEDAQIDRSKSYMPLDGIKTLLQVGINTTKNNFYHLSADIHAETKVVVDIDLSMECYIKVDGEKVKLYGTLSGMPVILGVSQDYEALYSTAHLTEFTFATYSDQSEDKVGGYFNIRRRTDRYTSFFGLGKKYKDTRLKQYKTDSKNFLDNIMDYLLGSMVGLTEGTVSLVGRFTTSSSEKAAGNFGNALTSTGFSCTTSGSNASTVHTIKVGMNLNELTGVDALKTVEATIKTKRVNGEDNLSSLSATLKVNLVTELKATIALSLDEASISDATIWNNVNSVFEGIDGKNFTATVNDPYSAMSWGDNSLRFSNL